MSTLTISAPVEEHTAFVDEVNNQLLVIAGGASLYSTPLTSIFNLDPLSRMIGAAVKYTADTVNLGLQSHYNIALAGEDISIRLTEDISIASVFLRNLGSTQVTVYGCIGTGFAVQQPVNGGNKVIHPGHDHLFIRDPDDSSWW